MKKSILLTLLLALFAFTAACGPTLKEDPEQAIERKLQDNQLDGVDVVVKDGVATLAGEVSTQEDKVQATSLARETEGVVTVQDLIKVKYSGGSDLYPAELPTPAPGSTDSGTGTGATTYDGEAPRSAPQGDQRQGSDQPLPNNMPPGGRTSPPAGGGK